MQLIQPIKCRAFTLVEMLVALAVSSIIIAATYASYEMVATQYKKNMDVADMHTSGRAIMRIIERDIRMAGFEYRDKDAKVTYGTISSPLTIKDSGNKCCDEVTVIYDYFDEESKKAERIRIRYWAGPHTSNKGSRHRLYKQKDILGQNKKILAKPKLGTKDVMADYIEDLQIINIVRFSDLYIGSNRGMVTIYDPATKKNLGWFNNKIAGRSSTYQIDALAFGPNGLLYIGSNRGMVTIYDPATKKNLGWFNNKIAGRSSTYQIDALAFGPNGLLYIGSNRGMVTIYDPATKKNLGWFNNKIAGRSSTYQIDALAFGPNGLLYIGSNRGMVTIYDPATKKNLGWFNNKIAGRSSTYQIDALAFGPNGLLYIGSNRGMVTIYDPATKKNLGWFNNKIAGRSSTYQIDALAFGPNGLLYIGSNRGMVTIYDPATKKNLGWFNNKIAGRSSTYQIDALAFKNKRTGQESLVTINLTLRTRNEYGKDRQFKKKDYHGGNFKIDKTDKYKRDTFSSTVLVRNLAL